VTTSHHAAAWSIIVGLVGTALVWWITPHGAGLSPDSVYYVAAARWALAGDGVRSLDGGGPLTVFAPLYPAVLAGAAWVSRSDALDAARWLNATLFALLLSLAGLLAARIGRRPAAGIAAALLLLVSKDILMLHAMAWSEPLAIVLGTGGLMLVARYIETGGAHLLLLAAIGLGLAALARYAAVPYAITGAAGLLLLDRATPPLRRTAKAVTLALLAAGPLLLRRLLTGAAIGPADRMLGFHPLHWSDLEQATATVIEWIVPLEQFSWLSVALLLLPTAAFGAWVFSRADPRARSPGPLALLLLFFAAVYVGFVIASRVTVRPAISLGTRILAPMQVALIIATAGIVARWLPNPISKGARLMLLAILLAVVAAQGAATARWARAARVEGLVYTRRSLRQSVLLARVRALPPTARLWSNAPDVVYIYTGRCARWVPPHVDPVQLRPNPSFASDWRTLLGQPEAYVAWFNAFTWRSYLPTESELATASSVAALASFTEGTLYRIAASGAESTAASAEPPCPPARRRRHARAYPRAVRSERRRRPPRDSSQGPRIGEKADSRVGRQLAKPVATGPSLPARLSGLSRNWDLRPRPSTQPRGPRRSAPRGEDPWLCGPGFGRVCLCRCGIGLGCDTVRRGTQAVKSDRTSAIHFSVG
jgi:hypothetical protein